MVLGVLPVSTLTGLSEVVILSRSASEITSLRREASRFLESESELISLSDKSFPLSSILESDSLLKLDSTSDDELDSESDGLVILLRLDRDINGF